jgi:5-methylthioribose kinase
MKTTALNQKMKRDQSLLELKEIGPGQLRLLQIHKRMASQAILIKSSSTKLPQIKPQKEKSRSKGRTKNHS